MLVFVHNSAFMHKEREPHLEHTQTEAIDVCHQLQVENGFLGISLHSCTAHFIFHLLLPWATALL